MRLILLKAVAGIGRAGEIVEVQPGFGRNYLLALRLAAPLTSALLERRQREATAKARKAAQRDQEHRQLAATANGRKLTLRQRAHGDRLFGSVPRELIRDELRRQLDLEVPVDAILLETSIRTIGDHRLTLQFGRHQAELRLTVTPYG